MSLADSKTRFSISVGAVEASALVSDIDLILRGSDDRRPSWWIKCGRPSWRMEIHSGRLRAFLLKVFQGQKQTAGHLFVNPAGMEGVSFMSHILGMSFHFLNLSLNWHDYAWKMLWGFIRWRRWDLFSSVYVVRWHSKWVSCCATLKLLFLRIDLFKQLSFCFKRYNKNIKYHKQKLGRTT